MIDAIIKKLVLETVLGIVKDKLIALFPWLGIPILSQIFGLILSKLGGMLVDEIGRVVSFAAIDSQANSDNDAYKKEVVNLKAAIDSNDEAQIAKAKADFKASLRKLALLPH